MELIKTYEDGWDCEPKLKKAVRIINQTRNLAYEIENCVRAHDLDYIVQELSEKLQEANTVLESINTARAFETIEYTD